MIRFGTRHGESRKRSSPRRIQPGRLSFNRAVSRLVLVVTTLAFAILVSVAASHLHVGADQDESCSICAAFGVGKLKGPNPSVAIPAPVIVTYLRQEPKRAPALAHNVVVVVLPPSCGPPAVA